MKNFSIALRSNAIRSLAAVVGLLGVSGCTSTGADSVSPDVEMVNHTAQALSTGTLRWANGTYSGCTSRTGAWSVRIAGTDAMDNPALDVVTNDTHCTLILTAIVADATYVATPSITMGTSYQTVASSFATDGNPVAFYGNSKLSSLDFASDFTLSILYADNLADASPSTTATYASVAGATDATLVPAPDYTATFDDLDLETDVNFVVDVASGSVGLTAGSSSGESYVISTDQSLGSAFADIDAAFTAGTPSTIGTSIAASALSLEGVTLPITRAVIIAHAVNGVRAYQVIRINFNAP